jgi:16S rRNA A1518/A1519 N6-dimethyltransferase RsmA/KsgA/DIM1 with predicted DNA glycosylase/AP lyase activity
MGKSEIRKMYNTLCVEQDMESPHSYHVFDIHYQPADIAVDIGAAEGIWALDIVEKVESLYLFECEENWIEALHATFAPWKEKIRIVNKYVADFNDNEHTTLDDYFLKKNVFPTIIKADIEGAEVDMVKGAATLLSKSIHHAILCTYHNFDDYTALSIMMQNHHFEVQTTSGYMAAIYMEPNYTCKDITQLFRKGVIHAHK